MHARPTPPASTTPSASSPCRLAAWVPLRLTRAHSRSLRLARTRSRSRRPRLHPRRLVRASRLRAPRLPAGFHQVRAPHTAPASRAEFGPLPRRPAPPASPLTHPAPLAGSRPPLLPASAPPDAAVPLHRLACAGWSAPPRLRAGCCRIPSARWARHPALRVTGSPLAGHAAPAACRLRFPPLQPPPVADCLSKEKGASPARVEPAKKSQGPAAPAETEKEKSRANC
nr:atherin-like [Aegilops tauschii subsp. strangulata]